MEDVFSTVGRGIHDSISASRQGYCCWCHCCDGDVELLEKFLELRGKCLKYHYPEGSSYGDPLAGHSIPTPWNGGHLEALPKWRNKKATVIKVAEMAKNQGRFTCAFLAALISQISAALKANVICLPLKKGGTWWKSWWFINNLAGKIWRFNMFAANPRFARSESRISFDMLKSLHRVKSVLLSKRKNPYSKPWNPETLKPKPKTLNPKLYKTLNPENHKSKSLRIASVFIDPLVTSIWYCLDVFFGCGTRGLEGTCFNPTQEALDPSSHLRSRGTQASRTQVLNPVVEWLKTWVCLKIWLAKNPLFHHFPIFSPWNLLYF